MNFRTLALILDGEVISVIKLDEPTATLLLSNPTIIDITSKAIGEGWKYEQGAFVSNIDGTEIVVEAN